MSILVVEKDGVYVFNLLNGMEIIGTVEDEDADAYYLKSSFTFYNRTVQKIDQNGNKAEAVEAGMVPYQQFGEDDGYGQRTQLIKTARAYTYKPLQNVYEAYLKQSSPIQIIPASSIIQTR